VHISRRTGPLALWAAAACFGMLGGLTAARGADCASLVAMRIPNIQIETAARVPENGLVLPGHWRPQPSPAFCRVTALATPAPDSHIRFEVWIPPPGKWNGKLLGTGNGGFSGAIGYAQMKAGVAEGYATVGTDTGHTGDQLGFGLDHPQRIVDWAYRSVHVMTAAAKLIIRDSTGRFPAQSYFEGCSTGGQQAFSEAQRYPADYDGIVAGAPGYDRIGLILGFLWSWIAIHDAAGRPLLSAMQLDSLTAAAVKQCDPEDGLRDGIVSDPLRCRFDPAMLACARHPGKDCLTAQQVTAVRRVYRGARDPRTGRQIFPGWIPGSESGWGAYLLDPGEPARLDFFKDWAFDDPRWDWHTFDWDRDVAYLQAHLGFVAATSADLSRFQALGGKLILYSGGADPVVPLPDVVNYYRRVLARMGGIQATQRFFRYFEVPGMGHCQGGDAPTVFDPLEALDRWVTTDQPPARIVAEQAAGSHAGRTRPLCPYPSVARYKGSGSTDSAANFICVAAKS
jgi:feruloyl esterase